MILLDSNVLLYAKLTVYEHHELVAAWLDERLNGDARVGMPWVSLLGFARLASNPRVFAEPLPVRDAFGQVADWLALPNVWVPAATPRHAQVVLHLAALPGITSRLVTDVHLAALAIEHGLTLVSADTGFARFESLRWDSPLDP